MPVINTSLQSKPNSKATGSNGVPNGLASLAACYGDSDSSDDADDEAEAEGSEAIMDKNHKTDDYEAEVVVISAVKKNSLKPTNEATKPNLGKPDDDVEFIGAVSNPQSESFKQVRIKEEPKSDDSSMDSDSDSSITSFDTSEDEAEKIAGNKRRQAPRVKGELSLYDLPPIEDLHISVPHEQCQPIGAIKSVVEPLVIVEAYPMTPALDIDSVLFLDEGDRALGRIFDVFGQVKQPHYCVRFNSLDHIDSQGIKPGMLVYCAPRTAHTTFVLVAQLKMMKGTDASWKDDIEPPPDQLEFSDDEMERLKKKGGRRGRVNHERIQNSAEAPSDGDVIPSGHPSQNQNRKRSHANQSTYIPAQVSGFAPPSRGGFRPGFRGRGRGGGGYPRGGQAWNGSQITIPFPPPNYGQQHEFRGGMQQQHEFRGGMQQQQHFFRGPTPFYNEAPPPPASPVPNCGPPPGPSRQYASPVQNGGPPRQYENPFVSYSNSNPPRVPSDQPPQSQWSPWPLY